MLLTRNTERDGTGPGSEGSTAPHRTRPPSSRARWLAGAVTVLVLAEALARLLSPSLPVAGYETLANRHLTRLADRQAPLDTLLVGTSTIGAGVDPTVLAEESAAVDSAYTFWLAGAGFRTVARAVTDTVLPRHEVDRLVIGVTSREFNAGNVGQEDQDQLFTDTFGHRSDTGRLSWLQRLEQRIGDLSALVRHRRALSSPIDLVRDDRSSYLGPDGMLLDRLGRSGFTAEPAHLEQERAAMADYRVNVEDLQALRDVLRYAADHGIQAVVVQMPVFEAEYLGLQPGLAEADAEFRLAVEQLVADESARYLDPRSELDWDDPALWGDVNHLNRRGADRLTSWLAHQLGDPQQGH